MELAPIVLFVYNRPEHTRACLEYLERKRAGGGKANCMFFADGAKSGSEEAVAAVRRVIAEPWKFKRFECRGATGEQGAGSQCDCGGDFGFGDARPGDRLGR